MLVEIFTLFAGARLGVATTDCRQWAQRKAGEQNHDIEKALLTAHRRILNN